MNTATPAQVSLIQKLKVERLWENSPVLEMLMENARDRWRSGQFTKTAASNVIDGLQYAPKRQEPVIDSAQQVESIEGMHRLDGKIFKVQVAKNGSGRMYAKELTGDSEEGFQFVYAPGAVRKLSASTRLSLEEAKEFGALYGTCCVCSRTLTDENSIAAGIGPVCAGKF